MYIYSFASEKMSYFEQFKQNILYYNLLTCKLEKRPCLFDLIQTAKQSTVWRCASTLNNITCLNSYYHKHRASYRCYLNFVLINKAGTTCIQL